MADDVIDLIKSDHRDIESLLTEIEQEGSDTLALLQQVSNLLLPHSEAEEELVYPAIRRSVSETGDEVKDGVAEHHHIEGMLTDLLGRSPDEPGFDGTLAALTGELRHHVEEEETELLPAFKEHSSEQERVELGVRFAASTNRIVSGDLAGPGAAAVSDPAAATDQPLAQRSATDSGEGQHHQKGQYETAQYVTEEYGGERSSVDDPAAAAAEAERTDQSYDGGGYDGYCPNCRETRHETTVSQAGRPIALGDCPVCGAEMSRILAAGLDPATRTGPRPSGSTETQESWHPSSDEEEGFDGYCPNCRDSRTESTVSEDGRPIQLGDCPVCGATMTRILSDAMDPTLRTGPYQH